MNQPRGDYGGNMVAWRGSGLGNDNQDLLGYGFNSLQIQQIMALHASGALSDAGYQIITSGFLAPGDLADFLAADPGAPETSGTHVLAPGATGISPTQVTQPLTPGPAPRVMAPTATSSISSFFTGSTLIAGVPNMVLLGGALLALTMLGGGGRRR